MDPTGSPKDPAAVSASPPPPPVVAEPATARDAAATELTPEEQMKRFEEELKETDWGHQPC